MYEKYLGDSVYIELNHFGDLAIYTFDGIKQSNRIYLTDIVEELYNTLQYLRHNKVGTPPATPPNDISTDIS